MKGLVCAGKRMHESLLEPDNAGVRNIERKYLEECQVKPKTISHRNSVNPFIHQLGVQTIRERMEL